MNPGQDTAAVWPGGILSLFSHFWVWSGAEEFGQGPESCDISDIWYLEREQETGQEQYVVVVTLLFNLLPT